MISIETYSRIKFIYEFIDAIGSLFFLSAFVLIFGQKTENALIEKYSPILGILFFLGIIWFWIRFFVGKMDWYNPINKTGNIEFYNDYLILNNSAIKTNQIKTIRIGVTQCKGQLSGGRSGISDGTGNYIEIFLIDKIKFKENLFIKNLQQINDLKLLMESWRKTGIMIIGNWKPSK